MKAGLICVAAMLALPTGRWLWRVLARTGMRLLLAYLLLRVVRALL